MLVEFEKRIADFLSRLISFGSADRVLLAVSGGADSTALLHSMCALKTEGILTVDFICAHINHQLRGSAANLDEDFVVAQARSLSLPVVTRRIDVRGFASENRLSIETAARKLRMESLLNVARANNCSWIATAHQKNDNAETIIQRLIRGTGFRGLAGIWPLRPFPDNICFVRPFLCVRRDEVIEYLKQRNLKWQTDHTNEDCRYRRNFIRHRLIPELQPQCSGLLAEELFDLSESARNFQSLICSYAEKVWPNLADCADDRVSLDLEIFSGQPYAVKVELIWRILAYLGAGERDLTQIHLEKILQLAGQNISGKRIQLPGRCEVRREYGNLIFAKNRKAFVSTEQIAESVHLEVPGRTKFDDYLIKATVSEAEQLDFEKFKAGKTQFIECFDLEKLKLPLMIRLRKAGDRFVPLGLDSEKKVGKFLTAARLPHQLRQKVLIIADSGKIIWVWPVRASAQSKITTTTRKILQLEITDAEGDY